MTDSELFIWDAEGAAPSGTWKTVLWKEYDDNSDPSVISMPDFVEGNSEYLKNRYLAWIYDLGESRVNGKRLIDHLELRSGFSYWWMTSFPAKYNALENSPINNAIKLMALERIIKDNNYQKIHFVSGNKKVALTIRDLCKKRGLQFKWQYAANKDHISWLRRIYKCLPATIQGVMYFFVHIFKNFPNIGNKTATTESLKGDITFIDVFAHLDKEALASGNFISNYWGELVEKLRRTSLKINWLHYYTFTESIPSFGKAHEIVNCFNATSDSKYMHSLADANLDFSVYIRAIKDYLLLVYNNYKLTKVKKNFSPKDSDISFWLLFKEEFADTMSGKGAVVNCLCLSLFEKIFSQIPSQTMGIYIQENHYWEMAMIYAWKSCGHGQLVGVPHITVRYWDLRYFYDHRTYEKKNPNSLPRPDQIAVNGDIAKNAFLGSGYPEAELVEVEALRFNYLCGHTGDNKPNQSDKNGYKVLICGDLFPSANQKMLTLLGKAMKSLPEDYSFIFKPHPARSINSEEYNGLKLKISDSDLTDLLKDCDVVLSSNITSAALVAYCFGLPVILILDGSTFNLSPLRDIKQVNFITNAAELLDALMNPKQPCPAITENFFYLNKKLPRWQTLLGVSF